MMASGLRIDAEDTVLDALCASLEERAAYNRNQQEPPAAILWTDEAEEWRPASDMLRGLVSRFYVLGPYAPERNQGPAIWLRCALAGKTDEGGEGTPVVYLPGVSRRMFRHIESLPDAIKPLAELQYRGVFFSQENGKDWTVSAFLQSARGGLGLDVASDQATRSAMVRAVRELLETDVAELRHRRLDAEDFNELLTPEMTRDLLSWLGQPDEVRARWTEERWKAFSERCEQEFNLDPVHDGVLVAAENLARREGRWSEVWGRFSDVPEQYPAIPNLLKRAAPDERDLFDRDEPWPHINEQSEDRLRSALAELQGATRSHAAERIHDLEAEHGERREWVWARMGAAPLAMTLPALVRLAEIAESLPHFRTLSEIESYYAEEGWRADRSVLEILNGVRSKQDTDAVSPAITSLYQPWLDNLAQRFQELVSKEGYRVPDEEMVVSRGTCLLFADGLRLDVAQWLRELLEEERYSVELGLSWSALPTVTPTAKPFNSPLREQLTGREPEDFRPHDRASDKPITADRFKSLLREQGYQVVEPFEDHEGSGRGWCEVGRIDKRGHAEGWRLARHIPDEIRGLYEAIQALFENGWKSVRVVTDHGWLLTLGELEKRDLPGFLTETRWSRCALLKEGAEYTGPLEGWQWNPDVLIAYPAGARVFYKGVHYTHGGMSPQECLVPELTIRREGSASDVQIEDAEWRHLRCQVRVSGPSGEVQVDLRQKVADPDSSIVDKVKTVEEGKATLFVVKDELLDEEVELVVLSEQGDVLARRQTRVGGDR